MDIPENEFPDFECTETDLLNFEEFCDEKYKDPLVQKLGFFKVHLHKDVRRKTTLKDILKNFQAEAYSAVKETVVIENPVNCGLYGHHSISVPNSFRNTFMKTARHEAFQICEAEANCCLKSLETGGTNGFLEHFYSELAAKALPVWNHDQRWNMSSINNKISTWRAAFDKRQVFQKQDSIEGKSRVLELCMQSEKFEEGNENEKCNCGTCAFLALEVPAHPDSPLGTLYSSGIDESYEKHVKLSENFSMIQLCYKNMLSMLDSSFNGVSFPLMYIGTCHTVFPIHVEDLSLWSFNFLLFGFPKFWIIVPPHSVARLTDALNRCGFGDMHKSCRNTLSHKFYIPNIRWLDLEGIPFTVVIQREGEGIVVLPNAAHSGGNLGHNVAQACNFGTESWIPYGCVFPVCSCLDNPVHVDLTPIVAVHKRSLLKAFIDNNVLNAADDEYFLRSVVLSKTKQDEWEPGALLSSTKTDKPRIKCPVCTVNWGSTIPKRNVVTHLQKYHSHQLHEDRIVNFLNDKFASKKK